MNFLPVQDHFSVSKDAELDIICERILKNAKGLPVGMVFYFAQTDNQTFLTLSTAITLHNVDKLKEKLREIMDSPGFYCFALSDMGEALIRDMRIVVNNEPQLVSTINVTPTTSPLYFTGSTVSTQPLYATGSTVSTMVRNLRNSSRTI